MMPLYMASYPHQRNQVPFAQYHHPSCDGIPPHLMVDQSKPPMTYESWPHGKNYGYSIPFHGCCNYSYFPGYYGFQPNFSHSSPIPPFYCCGHHHPFTEPYPLHYAPPLNHPMKQQRYEYDEDAGRDYHRCGCPNHVSNQKNDKGVIIEEQEPEVVKKCNSLVPVQSKIPDPTVWVPAKHVINSDEHRRHFEPEVADQEKFPHNNDSYGNMKSSGREPRVWDGWFPFNMNSLKSSMQGKDERRKQNQQNEDVMRQLSHPIFWMPSNSEQREPEKKDQRNMNSWFPLDMNSLKSSMLGEDENRKQNQQSEDGMRQLSQPIIQMPSNSEQRGPEKNGQKNANSWFPLDMNSLKTLMQGEDEKGMENHRNENIMGQFPYPIIWMPFKSKQGEAEKKDQKEMNAAPTPAEEPSSGFKFVQMKPSERDSSMKESETNKENPGGQAKSSQMKESNGNQKIIPVKPMEVLREDISEGAKKKSTSDNSSGSKKNRQSSSPPKTSKLPPVCLRLEPLPGKKKGNGNSKSPSPPSLNSCSQEDTPKPFTSSSLKEKTSEGTQSPDVSLKRSEELEPKKADQKVIDMVDGETCGSKIENLRSVPQIDNYVKGSTGSQETERRKSSTERNGKDNDECRLEKDKGVRSDKDVTAKGATKDLKVNDSAGSVTGEGEANKQNLSDVQATVLIQSLYRGFEVRKMENIKKLKLMAEVRQQVADVRNRIQALETSTDLLKNDKERVIIGEMIMRLLLKLDTIQGLHPSLRDIRKALAKDLVSLQEELDSLTMKSKELSEEVTAAKDANDPSIDTRADAAVQDMQNKDAGILENFVETSHNNSINMKEQDLDELSHMVDLAFNSQDQETSEPTLGEKDLHGKCENENIELPEGKFGESKVGESLADMERDEAANGEVDVFQAVKSEIQEGDDMHPQAQQPARPPLISEEETSSPELSGAQLQNSCCVPNCEKEATVGGMNGAINDEDDTEESAQLPLKLVDEEPDSCELENDEPAGKRKSEIVDGKIKCNMLAGQILPTEVDKIDEVEKAMASNMDLETNVVAELPIGVREEYLAIDNKQTEAEKTGPPLPTEDDNKNKVEKAIACSIDPETNLVAKLPIGVLEEDLAVDNIQIETGKNEVLSRGEARYNAAINTTSPTEADDVVNIMVEELPGNAVLDIEENPPLASIEGEERSNNEVHVDEDKDQGIIEVDQIPSVESTITNVAIEESKEETKEDQQQQVADGITEEEVLEKKSRCLEPVSVIDTDKMDEPNGSKITPVSQMYADENGIAMESDKKLIEENAKLREMMEKLMEAGKGQLTVISHLTGRVQDLEKALSRKKKSRTRRNKRATRPLSNKQTVQ